MTQYARRRIIPTEHDDQAAVIEWFDHYGPAHGINPKLLMASPNAAKRSYGLAARMKAEGMRAGQPDLFLAHPKLSKFKVEPTGWYPTLFHGLFIELKRKGWTPPKSGKALEHWERQLEYAQLLRKAGYNALVCIGADEAMQAIKGYVES